MQKFKIIDEARGEELHGGQPQQIFVPTGGRLEEAVSNYAGLLENGANAARISGVSKNNFRRGSEKGDLYIVYYYKV